MYCPATKIRSPSGLFLQCSSSFSPFHQCVETHWFHLSFLSIPIYLTLKNVNKLKFLRSREKAKKVGTRIIQFKFIVVGYIFPLHESSDKIFPMQEGLRIVAHYRAGLIFAFKPQEIFFWKSRILPISDLVIYYSKKLQKCLDLSQSDSRLTSFENIGSTQLAAMLFALPKWPYVVLLC